MVNHVRLKVYKGNPIEQFVSSFVCGCFIPQRNVLNQPKTKPICLHFGSNLNSKSKIVHFFLNFVCLEIQSNNCENVIVKKAKR